MQILFNNRKSMNSGLESLWKEVIVTIFEETYAICLDRLKKNSKITFRKVSVISLNHNEVDRLKWKDSPCNLVVRVTGYRSRDQGSIPGATRFPEKYVWNGVHSDSRVLLRSYLEEKVADPV
jgi:hypothetical protein